jgi:copper oxidase (laccase) domain-containing protein
MPALKTLFAGRYYAKPDQGNVGRNFGNPATALHNRLSLLADFTLMDKRKTSLSLGFSPGLEHGDKIIVATNKEKDKSDGIGITHSFEKIRGDTVMSNAFGFPLFFPLADCFSIALFDERRSAFALVHSGREGTLRNITGKTVQAMYREFHCKPANIIAHLFPGICRKCYRLDRPKNIPEKYEHAVCAAENGKIFLDLRKIIIRQLLDADIKIVKGVQYDNEECTCCTQNSRRGPKYFSHYGFEKNIFGHKIPGRNALVAEMTD